MLGLGLAGGALAYHLWATRTAAVPAPQIAQPVQAPPLSAPPSEEAVRGTVSEYTRARKAARAAVARKKQASAAKRAHKHDNPGVVVRDGRLRVEDWSAWMAFAPRMMNIAEDAGAKTAGDVLKVVLNTSLPQYPWPPPEGSRLREQWDKLAEVVAESLNLPNPPPHDGVDVVPHLRLVT